MIVDLNCDLGEGGPADAELMAGCTSVNLAAGGHAGGGRLLEEAVARARVAGVAIGAHPGYEDRANFGRVDLPLAPGDIAASVRWQVEAVRALAPLRHVKPHGALYKFEILDAQGQLRFKSDPMARWTEAPPATASRVRHETAFAWTDADWMARRAHPAAQRAPTSIHEVHLGTWTRGP